MAAPTVGAVMADILPYLGVEQEQTAEQVAVEDLKGMRPEQAQQVLKKQGLVASVLGTGETVTGQIPEPGQQVSVGTQVLVYLDQELPQRQVTVPDFSGMTRQQASDTAGKLGLLITVSGNDTVAPNVTVVSQSYAKDSLVPVGTSIRLQFADTTAAD